MGELLLRLDQVTLAYGERVVLDRVSLEAPPGQLTGLVGPNGCGKSTLIRGVTRILAARTGRIFIDGKSVDQVSRAELARLVAVVPQNAALPELFTAFELVLLGRTPHLGRFRYESKTDLDIVWRAMELTDTAALARRRVGELSGGERQRLTIARALAQQPKILLLDEPTAHLDINHQAQALDLVVRLCREENLVAVAALHDLNLAAQYCRRVIMLSCGGVYRQGTPEEVFTVENIRAVYGANVVIERHPLTGVPFAFAIPGGQGAAVENVAVLALALALDVAFGDPPNAIHPVAWLGRIIALVMRAAPRQGRVRQFVFGLAVVVVTVGSSAAMAWYAVGYLQGLSPWLYVPLAAVALKLTFSIRGLRRAATAVKSLLQRGSLDRSRDELKALCGRDAGSLNESQVVSGVVESVAENSCDSIVAPLFYFLLFGLPGAAAYRVINTFDSMIGRYGRWEYLGKFAAYLDTTVNWVPARLSALLIVIAAALCRRPLRDAWRVMRRDRRRTASPNAGWTMSAAAGALGVRLEKAGYYSLGDESSRLDTGVIDGSLRLLTGQVVVWSLLCLGIVTLRGVFL